MLTHHDPLQCIHTDRDLRLIPRPIKNCWYRIVCIAVHTAERQRQIQLSMSFGSTTIFMVSVYVSVSVSVTHPYQFLWFQYHVSFLSAGAALAATMEFLQALVITGVSGLSFKSLLHVSHALPGNQYITGEFSYTYQRI